MTRFDHRNKLAISQTAFGRNCEPNTATAHLGLVSYGIRSAAIRAVPTTASVE